MGQYMEITTKDGIVFARQEPTEDRLIGTNSKEEADINKFANEVVKNAKKHSDLTSDMFPYRDV
jgi:hypothetical protein